MDAHKIYKNFMILPWSTFRRVAPHVYHNPSTRMSKLSAIVTVAPRME